MSKVFPKLEELYIVLANDCYLLFLIQNFEKKKNIIKKLYQQRKNKSDILDILVLIKSNISANKSKLKKYSDITSFSLEYFNTISEFFARNDISNNEVRYANDFCLSYIALIGFRNVLVDLEEDEIFIFQSEK